MEAALDIDIHIYYWLDNQDPAGWRATPLEILSPEAVARVAAATAHEKLSFRAQELMVDAGLISEQEFVDRFNLAYAQCTWAQQGGQA